MASYELTMLREKLVEAEKEESRTRVMHAIAMASVDALKKMIRDAEADNEEVNEPPGPAPEVTKPLRFSCDQNPKYDQAVDIAAYTIARRNFAKGETGLKGELPYGLTFPIRTTLKGGGIGEIQKQSFEMRVGNYESHLKGTGTGLNAGSKVKVIKDLCQLNPTDAALAEAYAYYSTRQTRE